MKQTEKIGVQEFTVLVITFTLGSSILITPSILATFAKQDAWISAALGTGIGVLLVVFYNQIAKRYPKQSLPDYCETILGKWIGRFLFFLYIGYFLILASLLLREIGDFLTTSVMTETPIYAVHIIFAVIVVMGTRLGIETLCRATQMFFPWLITLYTVSGLTLIPKIKFEQLLPIYEGGIKPILHGAFSIVSLPYGELVVFLMILPLVHDPAQGRKKFVLGAAMGGTLIVITSLISILVLGPFFTARNLYPSFAMAKMINVGGILQRIEALIAGVWFLSIYCKLTFCFYVTCYGLGKVLKLEDYRFLTYPLGVILVIMSIYTIPNTAYFQKFVSEIWTPYSLTYCLFIPLLLLIVDMVKKKV